MGCATHEATCWNYPSISNPPEHSLPTCTTLDLRVAHGRKSVPDWAAPHLAVIRELGKQHEAAYLDYLVQRKKMAVVNLADIKDETLIIEETLRLMEGGAEMIAQGALADGKWFGRPKVKRRVTTPVAKWNWSYEVADTKLTPDTKAAKKKQLSLDSWKRFRNVAGIDVGHNS